MNIIQGITDQPRQTIALALPDGSRATLTLEYRANQLAWFADVLNGDFTVKGIQLSSFPNLLRQFRKRISFGLSILGAGDLDPASVDDFVNGNAIFYLLDQTDVEEIEATIFIGS